MKAGKAFEIFVKRLLMCVGFSEVMSDGLYIYDAAPGQMIQGLGEAHNADVLLEPPVQTPFCSLSRLLIECKDYKTKVGLNTLRGVLGLKEDVNHFDIVDLNELIQRRNTRRTDLTYKYTRYHYQVAVAALNGFTVQAQKFAATYRIPLIEFNKMPFWETFLDLLGRCGMHIGVHGVYRGRYEEVFVNDEEIEQQINEIADEIGRSMAIAITNSGQLLFLYKLEGERVRFDDYFELHWGNPKNVWQLSSGNTTYVFQLPEDILKSWLSKSKDELEMRREAINCKAAYFSNMVVYYTKNGLPTIKMISIDRDQLDEARRRLNMRDE